MKTTDLEISSLSYTDKDFPGLYEDVIDIADNLSNRWDPAHSNESDPGVVLLKEAAFVADHNNYNIDKNILENFLPSATQDRSVRNICEMNGYTPRYYVSANGVVNFTYTYPKDDAERTSFTIPQFSLVITDENSSVTYTQAEPLVVIYDQSSPTSATSSCKFIEGVLKTLSLNRGLAINLENLDDNNRIYFPEVMVAQNGVYISNINQKDFTGYWERDNYLLTQPTGTHCYKLDYDSSRGLPYVEFPTDISSLIGDGIKIQYISTSGSTGNVKAKALTNIVSPAEFTLKIAGEEITRSTEDFLLSNPRSFENGKDPETIDQMYQSFKRTVGTFDTLVTCKDYSNAAYNLEDTYGNPIISNVIVTDRRTDYNKALNVVTHDENGTYLKNISIKPAKLKMLTSTFKTYADLENIPNSDAVRGALALVTTDDGKGHPAGLYVQTALSISSSKEWEYIDSGTINLNDFAYLTEAMTPYDLVIYALNAYNESDYNVDNVSKEFNKSFTPAPRETVQIVKDMIDTNKCICHNYNNVSENEVVCFKNYVPLNISLKPFIKVGDQERYEIIANVHKAISDNFNARKMNWGEVLDTAELKRIIIESDDRLKDADIAPITYGTKVMTYSTGVNNSNEALLTEKMEDQDHSYFLDLVTKNVMAGRLCMFSFDESFKYEYGQVGGMVYQNIESIKTEIPIVVKTFDSPKVQTSRSSGKTTVVDYDYLVGDGSSKVTRVDYKLYAPSYNADSVAANLAYELQIDTAKKTPKNDLFIYKTYDDNLNELSTATFEASPDKTFKIQLVSETDDKILNSSSKSESKNLQTLAPGQSIVIEEINIFETSEPGQENVNYTLKENEVVQIINPNFYSEKSYGLYVNYRYIGENIIRANTDYALKSGEKIVLIYNKEGQITQDIINNGEIVKSSFDLVPTDTGITKTWVDDNGITHQGEKFQTLATNQTISTRKAMDTVLNSQLTPCLWIVDGGRLFEGDEESRILTDGEYFMYANSTLDEMMILGAGTKLTRSNLTTTLDVNNWYISEDYNISTITEKGLAASLNWRMMDFSVSNLTITEMSVITLTQGDQLIISGWNLTSENQRDFDPNNPTGIKVNDEDDGKVYVINNQWQDCDGSISYILASDPNNKTILSKNAVGDSTYKIRSRLDLQCASTLPQSLLYSVEWAYNSEGTRDINNSKLSGVQKLIIDYDGGRDTIVSAKKVGDGISTYNYKIQTSLPMFELGRNAIVPKTKLDLYRYSEEKTSSKVIAVDYDKTLDEFVNETEGVYHFRARYPFFYNADATDGSKTPDATYLLPIQVVGKEIPLKAQILDSKGNVINKIFDYNISESNIRRKINSDDEDNTDTIIMTGDTTYFIQPDVQTPKGSNLTLEITWDVSEALTGVETFTIDQLKSVRGINELISNDKDVNIKNICNRITTILDNSDSPSTRFYYCNEPDNSMSINLLKYCVYNKKTETFDQLAFDNPNVMWDVNNLANPITIAQIDIPNSIIDVETTLLKD